MVAPPRGERISGVKKLKMAKVEFIRLPENSQMRAIVPRGIAAACAFLLKADPQYISHIEDEDATADFLISLYQKHFLCQFLSRDTVALIHFANSLDRQNAEIEIFEPMEKEVNKMGAEIFTPYHPMVIERVKREKEKKNIYQLFVLQDETLCPVGSKPDIPNFTTAYPLAEINRHKFIVGTERSIRTSKNKAKMASLSERLTELQTEFRTPNSDPTQFMSDVDASRANPHPQLPLYQQHQPTQRQPGNSNNPPAAQASPSHTMPVQRPPAPTFSFNMHARRFIPTTKQTGLAEDSSTNALKF